MVRKWGAGNEPRPPKTRGLKELDSLNILVGGLAGEELGTDSALRKLILKEYNMFTIGEAFKWRQLLNDPKNSSSGYNFATTDSFAQFASDNNLFLKGHTLMWSKPSFLPSNYPGGDVAARQRVLDLHIAEVVGHFKGKVNAWDVWNEPINLDGVGLKAADGAPPVTLQEIGRAFVAARKADPDALLLLTDFHITGGNLKTQTMLDSVRALKTGGAPIDAVGMQCHFILDGPRKNAPTETEFSDTLAAYNNIGIQVFITELDIRIAELPNTMSIEEKLKAQKDYAEMIMYACNQAPNCHSVSTWGVSDKYSWIYDHDQVTHPAEQPLPFDLDFKRKPFYNGLYIGGL